MSTSCVLSILLFIFLNSAHADPSPPNQELLSSKSSLNPNIDYSYACIVDAGSTGSRIHVYRYSKPQNSALISVDIASEQYRKFKPGLSSFEDHPTNIAAMGDYLEPILNFARDNVPLSKRTDTPLFVLASAGLRKVRDRNTKTARQIIDITYKYLSESSEFIVLKQGVKIIEGRDEGLWGWIAANYLNGELASLMKLRANALYTQQTTKGVLEMGGESLQITFIPQSQQLSHSHEQSNGIGTHIESVMIGDVSFQLFTYSWMGIGMEAAQNRYDTYLATTLKQRDSSPCYIKGDTRDRTHAIGQAITWMGGGSFSECYKGLNAMIDEKFKSKCAIPKIDIEDMICTPNSIVMPKIDLKTQVRNEFYYIENFYYTAKVLGLDGVHGKEFLDKLEEKGAYYCGLSVETAKREFPQASEDEISKTCFCAAWLLAVLKRGFELDEFGSFRVIRNIEGEGIEGEGAIDWALGYLIAEVPNMSMSEDTIFTGRFLLIVAVVLAVMYCWYRAGAERGGHAKTWIYSKIYSNGIVRNEGNIKKEHNKYAYQQLNVRRTV